MPVCIVMPPLPAEVYDRAAALASEPLRGAAGFLAHTASDADRGVIVSELWRSEDDWRRFFEANVAPAMPPGLPSPRITRLRNAILP